MVNYLYDKVLIEQEEIKKIADDIEKYNTFFKDVANSAIGTYSINKILETVEESLNYLEIFAPLIKNWVNKYLEDHRGRLWLFYGISKGNYLTDYWKISESNFSELSANWPFLYGNHISDPKYKDFQIDLKAAQNEVLRQRERQNTTNPKYTPFHPDGCSSGCSCWMLDDMEQWYEEEKAEIAASTNIFFNSEKQKEFYKVALENLDELKEQWEIWIPIKSTTKSINSNLEIIPGQTPIKIVISWIKNDFYFSSIFSMFHWSDIFKEVWNNIDSVEDFIKCEREKLKKIVDLI
jgi:hypothetical protein